MKRRQVLQSMAGAAGIGLATAPSQGQIDGQVKETQFNPSSTESFKKFEDVFGSLAVETLDHTEEKKETGVRTLSQIKTDIGTGRVVSIHTEENSKNITALDIERSNLGKPPKGNDNSGNRGQPPDIIKDLYDLPQNTNPVLYISSGDDQFKLLRDTRAPEKQALAKKIGSKPSKIKTSYQSRHGGYIIQPEGEEDVQKEDLQLVKTDSHVTHPPQAKQIIENSKVTEFEQDDDVGAQFFHSCSAKCAECFAVVGGCGTCCTAATLWCVNCIIVRCHSAPAACYDCLDCV